MDDAATPLAEVEGVDAEAATAFSLVGDETRLSILVALWAAYDPHAADNAVSFSALRDRVGIRQGAQFNYHLDQLVDHFVEKSDAGYELRRAGFRLVRSVIAGIGRSPPAEDPTEIDVDCPQCGAATAVLYRDEWLYLVCTNCAGFFEGEDRPAGMLSGMGFDAAGLVDRDAAEQWRAGWQVGKAAFQQGLEGVCDACSGPMQRSLAVCRDHDPDGVCSNCGRQPAAIARFECPVCKQHHEVPPRTLVIHHPAVIAFYHDRGVAFQYADTGVAGVQERGELIAGHEQSVVGMDPPRVRVTIEYAGDELAVTLDEDVAVVDTDLATG